MAKKTARAAKLVEADNILRDRELAKIALKALGVSLLDSGHLHPSDDGAIRDALERAYAAGRAGAWQRQPTINVAVIRRTLHSFADREDATINETPFPASRRAIRSALNRRISASSADSPSR